MLTPELMISDFKAILDDCGQQVTINDTQLLAVIKDGGTEMLGETDERSDLGIALSVMELRFLWEDFPHLPRIGADLTIDGELWVVSNR